MCLGGGGGEHIFSFDIGTGCCDMVAFTCHTASSLTCVFSCRQTKWGKEKGIGGSWAEL
jgi:hypothetical protein